MAIPIKFDDDKIDHVPNAYFDMLLDSGCISAFKRSDGEWVDIKKGKLRGDGSSNEYLGPERRKSSNIFKKIVAGSQTMPDFTYGAEQEH